MPHVPSNQEPNTALAARIGVVRRGRVLLAGTLALGAVVLVVVFGFTKPNVIYARTVSEFAKQPLRERTVRLTGFLVHKSLCKVPSTCEYRFRLTDGPHPSDGPRNELEVRYRQCVLPETLGDIPGLDLEVAVEGRLCDECRHFDAEQVLAKCPSKYEIRYDGGTYPARLPIPSCASKSAESNAGE